MLLSRYPIKSIGEWGGMRLSLSQHSKASQLGLYCNKLWIRWRRNFPRKKSNSLVAVFVTEASWNPFRRNLAHSINWLMRSFDRSIFLPGIRQAWLELLIWFHASLSPAAKLSSSYFIQISHGLEFVLFKYPSPSCLRWKALIDGQ